MSALFAVQDGRQRLVNQKAQQRIQQALDQRERQVEHDQAFQQAVCGRAQRLVRRNDVIQPAEQLGVYRIAEKDYDYIYELSVKLDDLIAEFYGVKEK